MLGIANGQQIYTTPTVEDEDSGEILLLLLGSVGAVVVAGVAAFVGFRLWHGRLRPPK